MCRSKTKREKLDEFRRLQKLHWEGMPSQQGISKSESADQTINQHSDGFSIVNLQWASFASGATVIIAIVGVLVTICCYFRARNDRRRRERHHQLIETILGRVLPGQKPPGRAHPLPTEPDAAQHDIPPVLAESGWYRKPNGDWAGAPVSSPAISQHALPAILAAAGGQVHGIQQLPFPGFPPVNYQPAGLSSSGMLGCRTSGSVTYKARPAIACDRDRFTEIRDEPQPQLSHSSSSLISQGRPHPSPPSPTPFLPSQEGKDRLLGSQGEDELPSLSLKGKQIQLKLRAASKDSVPASGSRCPDRSPPVGSSKLESGQTLSEKTRPAMSVKDYNKAKLSRPGCVYSLKVSF